MLIGVTVWGSYCTVVFTVQPGSMANLPQDIKVWPGLKLQACVKEQGDNIINGLEYEVLGATDQIV